MSGKGFVDGRGYGQADWNAVSDDTDCSPDAWRDAKPFAELFPDLANGLVRDAASAGRTEMTRVSLRVSADVLDRFKAGGPGWQARIDEALRKAVGL